MALKGRELLAHLRVDSECRLERQRELAAIQSHWAHVRVPLKGSMELHYLELHSVET